MIAALSLSQSGRAGRPVSDSWWPPESGVAGPAAAHRRDAGHHQQTVQINTVIPT